MQSVKGKRLSQKMGKTIDFTLRQLLLNEAVGTHQEVCDSLKKQGINVNQSKVSRLLHKIGAVKVIDQNGQNIYRLPHEHGLMHEINISVSKFPYKQVVISIEHNSQLIMVQTTPGAASLIAREIDLHRLALGVMGSIAGDDTIFVAPKEVKSIKAVIEKLRVHFAL